MWLAHSRSHAHLQSHARTLLSSLEVKSFKLKWLSFSIFGFRISAFKLWVSISMLNALKQRGVYNSFKIALATENRSNKVALGWRVLPGICCCCCCFCCCLLYIFFFLRASVAAAMTAIAFIFLNFCFQEIQKKNNNCDGGISSDVVVNKIT